MSQISRHRRFKRATVLIKRTQCLGRYPRNRSCMPSYEKLRSNNTSLAKALSQQKQKGQLLFSQNVALIAEVQDLSSACNKRDNTIVKVLQNAKEILKMLVTMTKCVTNTIASCQEFAASSNMNLRMSGAPMSRGENRRLSTKSPTKGIVKPMVGGHTITKPTINLSRVNMQHFNNPSSLSTIEEVSTPIRLIENPSISNDSNPSFIPVSRQAKISGARTCRMPERLSVNSSRISEENERRISKRKSKHSGQLYERHSRSKSNRLSESNLERHSIECTEVLGSPRVKLNDVSKLLQNCQTINIRRLGSIQDDFVNESIEMNDSTNNASIKKDKDDNIISETQLSIDLTDENIKLEETNDSKEDSDDSVKSNKKSLKNEQSRLNIQTNNRNSHDNVSDDNDPLEGPSWLYNNQTKLSSLTNTNIETNNARNSNKSSNVHKSNRKTSVLPTTQHNSSSNSEPNDKETDSSCFRKSVVKPRSSEKRSILNNSPESDDKIEEDLPMNNQGFVTRQRGHSTEAMEDDLDDFTLMYMRRPINNAPFDINDLKLPVLEDFVVKSVDTKEPEPEITTTLQKITQNCLIPCAANDVKDDSLFDPITAKLPLLSNTAIDCTIPVVDISLDISQQKKLRKTNKTYATESPSTTSREKRNKREKKKSKNDKDPSAVKVVLEKLNDSHVKSQMLSTDDSYLPDSNSLSRKIFDSSLLENSSDSEGSTGSVNLYTESALKRPRRQKAPQNLKEPNLMKKLRRLQ